MRPPPAPRSDRPAGLAALATCVCALLALLLSGCGNGGIECEGNQNCPADAACIQNACVKRACITSAQCKIEQYCEQQTGQCVGGCLEDSDCPYGEACKTGTCEPRGCRSTELDCAAGQYCDPFTGTCFDAAGPFCTPCTTAADCGGGNNRCTYSSGGTVPYCAPECSDDKPCPAGYDCVPFTSNGQIISYNCITLCENIPAESAARSTARARPSAPAAGSR